MKSKQKPNLIAIRISNETKEILQSLSKDLSFNKSEIIRRSIQLFKELKEIKKKSGEILIETIDKKEKLLVLF